MSDHPAFELLRDETIPEIASEARLYRHKTTGAEVVSLANSDENKVFGIAFKTPPADSTGIAHILEHSVLCGSRKYPVKKPFVELLKGSLHTFLNAMTFPDKTAYPVASQNLKDFYNLVDVYLDAVFFPVISEDIFRQEGWHYEVGEDSKLTYKGVVFNEMKGAFSSPDAVLGDASMRSLFPDTTYGYSSGGDPKVMPDLSYSAFKSFHQRYYHPSNARAFFSGDDDPAQRLAILDAYFSQFERSDPDAEVRLQPRFNAPRQVVRTYPGTPQEGRRRDGMVTVNWMLDPIEDDVESLKFAVLEHALIGTAAAPLRKVLTDSGLGEGFAGSGFSDSLRQPTVSLGLKGIDPADAGRVEALILETLQSLSEEGIDKGQLAASLNTLEFSLRENNTGSFPRGISLMFRSLRTWLHDGDPLRPLAFEAALSKLKAEVAADPHLFENMIKTALVDNVHRTTVILSADPELGEKERAEEREKLDAVRERLDDAGLRAVHDTMDALQALQNATDAPEDLAKIPALTLEDLPRVNKTIPTEFDRPAETETLFHDLPTGGVIYLDLAFDLHGLAQEQLPYLPLFARALVQTGTSKEDFVSLSQRIGRETGGIGASVSLATRIDGVSTAAHLIVRAKATPEKASELLFILQDVLTDARLDNRDRIRQMVLETKAGLESRLAPMGNRLVDLRLRSGLNEADWISEQLGGVSYLQFIRQLADRLDSDWDSVRATLFAIRDRLIGRAGAIANVTVDHANWSEFRPRLENFLLGLPAGEAARPAWTWSPRPRSEGLVIPAQVNFVGKGANLHALGYERTGATSVVLKHLNTTWLWDKVRVQGGAYGGSSRYDGFSGAFTFLSYRDPNVLETLAAYDGAAAFLQRPIGEQELTRSIIGVIGDVDSYMLPDAKGFTALQRHLLGSTDAIRQQRRDEVLGAGSADFRRLADVLGEVAREGHVAVMGSEGAITAANAARGGFLETTRVM